MSPRKSVTIDTIARRAGVSKSAVSLALSGAGRLAPATRDAIRRLAAELGYKPPVRERVVGRTRSIGVLLDRRHCWPREEYFTQIIRGFEDEAARHGFHTLFSAVDPAAAGGADKPPFLRPGMVDALVAVGITDPEFVRSLGDLRVPVVSVAGGRRAAPRTDSVINDDFQGMEDVIRHLAGLGHRAIAFIGGAMEHLSSLERFRAFRIHADEILGAYDPALADTREAATDTESGRRACARLVAGAAPFTALVCMTDEMAVGAMDVLAAAGRRVPRDVSVAGFDDKSVAALARPPLTTVRISCAEMGRMAYELVHHRLTGASIMRPIFLRVGAELVVRASTSKVRGPTVRGSSVA